MKMNKIKFLKTEFGGSLGSCIIAWDQALEKQKKYGVHEEEYKEAEKTALWCQAQWEVYQMAVKQFYGVEYFFSWIDEYFGVCTNDESDWLFKRIKYNEGTEKR